jgi:uncharacterized repeat protein (TIGR03837 family)
MTARQQWDIFCSVVDNFGDIGVCWRLARQLQTEYPVQVRLWVDDLHSFQRICAEVEPTKMQQRLANGVEVIGWIKSRPIADLQLHSHAADVVIEAFGCELPAEYLTCMAERSSKPLWLNLEYLSAEAWIEGCHALPSPHPQLPLQKYFYFPGFNQNTGGVLRERGLLQQVSRFQQEPEQQRAFLQSLGVEQPDRYALKLCLFAYSHPRLMDWLDALAQMDHNVLCLVPAGALAAELRQSYPQLHATDCIEWGQLRLQLLPFVDQLAFDQLLWCCDINFVRGEDSLIRAIWAGRPFNWQLYRQQDNVHLDKLNAFWQLYQQGMPAELQVILQAFWQAWNQQSDLLQPWQQLMPLLPDWQQHARHWQQQLSLQDDLAKNLVRFVEKKFILMANFS